MSCIYNLIKKLNPDEQNFNNLVNKSFFGTLYSKVSLFINYFIYSIKSESILLNNLDNIYMFFLAVTIFLIPFASTDTLGIFASILIIISIVSSLLKHTKFKFSKIHVPVFVYLGILFISVGFSSLFMPSLNGFIKMLIYIGSFFSFFEFLKRNPKKILFVIALIAISCSIELLFSLKQMLFGVEELASWQDKTTLNPENMINRIYGTLKPLNPNLFAAYLISTVPCLFATTIYTYYKKLMKPFYVFAIFTLLALITVIQTGCRGAYVGLFFGMVFFALLFFISYKYYFLKKNSFNKAIKITLATLIIGCVLIVCTSPSIMHRLTSIFAFRGDSSNSYRINVYISTLKMFLDNFWIGIGPGNTTYRLMYGLYMVTGFDALGAYNIYLEMAVESGIFALLTFLWMMLLTLFKSIKNMFELSGILRLVIISCLSGIIAMMMHGFFDTVWYRPQLQLIFWLYMAILAVLTLKGIRNAK